MADPSDKSGYGDACGVSGSQPKEHGRPPAPLDTEDLARLIGPPEPGKSNAGSWYGVVGVILALCVIGYGLLSGMVSKGDSTGIPTGLIEFALFGGPLLLLATILCIIGIVHSGRSTLASIVRAFLVVATPVLLLLLCGLGWLAFVFLLR
jgi:hypothetical protein